MCIECMVPWHNGGAMLTIETVLARVARACTSTITLWSGDTIRADVCAPLLAMDAISLASLHGRVVQVGTRGTGHREYKGVHGRDSKCYHHSQWNLKCVTRNKSIEHLKLAKP